MRRRIAEVLVRHAVGMVRPRLAIFLVFMFSITPYMPMVDAEVIMVGSTKEVVIGSGPNGVSGAFEIEVPVGEVVTQLELGIMPKVWPVDEVDIFETKADFDHPEAIVDGADLNQTGLRILPIGHEWGFEGSTQGWTMGGGGWAHGYDSTLGATNGVHSGASAIYTYNGNYPNYMGTTYYATSPVIDCTSCSGTWDLKYWRRLGVESSSYDHAYVQVKNTAGSWSTIYSNGGSMNDGSYTQISHTVSSYVNGNTNFQIRFGLGSTDGSVTYTGWNVDDVLLEPRGNVGTGTANWTSPGFATRGLMSFDAEIPSGALFKWGLIDADDGTYINGFRDRIDLIADLNSIPLNRGELKLVINMESSGVSPVIHSIRIGGSVIEGFHEDPTPRGWIGHTGFGSNGATGSSTFESPEWISTTPFSRVDVSFSRTGSGTLEASFDDGAWTAIPESGLHTLESPATSARVRFVGSGSWSISHFSMDLHRNSFPLNAGIDVGLDGTEELVFGHPSSNSTWLHQSDLLGLDELILSSTGGNATIPFQYSGLKNIRFFVTPVGAPIDDFSINVSTNSLSFPINLGFVAEPTLVEFSGNEIQDILNAQVGNTFTWTSTAEQKFSEVDIELSSASGGDVSISGLSSMAWSGVNTAQLDEMMIRSVNAELANTQPVNGSRIIAIPFVSDSPAAFAVELLDIGLTGTPNPISITMTNSTETLVAGEDWYEFTTVFDFSPLGVSDPRSQMISEAWNIRIDIDGSSFGAGATCQITTDICTPGYGLLIDTFSHSFNGAEMEFIHRVRLSSIWPSDEAASVKTSINMAGRLSQPATIEFGEGLARGVEQDIEVVDWRIVSPEGIPTPWDATYYDPDITSTVEVYLNFNSLNDHPRTGAVTVQLLLDGSVVDTSTDISAGVVTLSFQADPLASEIDLEVKVAPMYDQELFWRVPHNATFLIDDQAPLLLDSNVARYDHRPLGLQFAMNFEIGDRPVLPSHAQITYSRSWEGFSLISDDLALPENLSKIKGTYSYLMDTQGASEGDFITGWIEVADPAGHLLDGGSAADPLFTVRMGDDGAPLIGEEGLGWALGDSDWLHPGDLQILHIPLHDENGYGDISEVIVDMASDSNENLTITWRPVEETCESSSTAMNIESCSVLGETNHFDQDFTLAVAIRFDWDFNPDTSIQRRIQITAIDDSGQSARHEISNLLWTYSSEIEVDSSSVEFVDSSSFVAAGSEVDLSAEIIWSKDGSPVMQIVDVAALIDGTQQYGLAENGSVLMTILAPDITGIHPITLDVVNLPIGGIDRTDSEEVMAWLVVDSHPPRVIEMLSPNPNNVVQERDWENLEFEIMFNETEGLDTDSMRLHWLIVPAGFSMVELALLGGNSSMELIAGTGSGNSIPMAAIVNLAMYIPDDSRGAALDMWVWVTGNDLAGQEIDDAFNSRDSPIAILRLAHRQPILEFSEEDITFSRPVIEVRDRINIGLTLHNHGLVNGTTSVRIEAVHSDGTRSLITVDEYIVPAEGLLTKEHLWIPEIDGAVWIEVSLPDGTVVRTSPQQVDEGSSTFVIGGFDKADGGMMTLFSAVAGLLLLLLGYLLMTSPKRKMTEEDYL